MPIHGLPINIPVMVFTTRSAKSRAIPGPTIGHCEDWIETGEGGIRTPGTGLNPYNGLANRRFKPLSHLSKANRNRTIAAAVG